MLKVNIFGDFVATGRLEGVLKAGSYQTVFGEHILNELFKSDYNIVNLEAPITQEGHPIDKLGPHLKSPPELLDLFEYGNFNIATLANNHIMDYDADVLDNTFKYLSNRDIKYVGAGNNLNGASKPLILEKDGVEVGIINIAEHEFSLATDEKPGANPLDPIQNHYQIKELRGKVDQIVVVVHGGHEHYEYPSPRMQDTYRFFIDSGADLVVGHHPHCFSGYESYNEGLIFYSLGNFVFDKEGRRNEMWNYGFGLSLQLSEERIDFNLLPYEQFSEEPQVYQLEGGELKEFNSKLKQINSVIEDRDELEVQYEHYCQQRAKALSTLFEPYENRYLKALRARDLFPSVINKKKYLRLYNYLMCQAHRDLVEYKLEMEIDKQKI